MNTDMQRAREAVADAIDKASRLFDVPALAILGATRHARIVEARHHAMMLARDEYLTLEEIGQHMDRNHETVSHGIKKSRQRVIESLPFRTTRKEI
jgi:chromosomal replication initiation ATPase DnaA